MTGTGWGFQQRGEENQACAVGLLLLRLPWSQEKLRVLRTMGESSHLLRWPWQTPSKLCCPDRLHLQAGQVPLDPKQACPSRLKPESSKNSHLVFWKKVKIHFTGTSLSTATREITEFFSSSMIYGQLKPFLIFFLYLVTSFSIPDPLTVPE